MAAEACQNQSQRQKMKYTAAKTPMARAGLKAREISHLRSPDGRNSMLSELNFASAKAR